MQVILLVYLFYLFIHLFIQADLFIHLFCVYFHLFISYFLFSRVLQNHPIFNWLLSEKEERAAENVEETG